eukprot:TRINITY_DN10439_c0_g1_i1.p1 TRINITY_DN10439_c0_g1~~TRINITY_DN10439_c0_g1_i1.p1  ORF type:complete len:750 (+),score=145.07 TRINITY_DN10439_c0_g1_i1:234-2483(+)
MPHLVSSKEISNTKEEVEKASSVSSCGMLMDMPMEEDDEKLSVLVESLCSAQLETCYKAARALKNAAIGSKVRKGALIKLGAFERLLKIIETISDEATLIEAITALGSLCYVGDDSVKKLRNSDALIVLVRLLRATQNSRVLLATVRSIKIILQTNDTKVEVFNNDETIDRIVQLLSHSDPAIVEASATILGHILHSTVGEEIKRVVIKRRGLEATFSILCSPTSYPKNKQSALEVLTALYSEPESLSSLALLVEEMFKPLSTFPNEIPNSKYETKTTPFEFLLHLLKDRQPRIQLLAASCIANISRVETFPYAEYQAFIQCKVLPAVIQLLDESDPKIREEAPLVLANLIADKAELQKAATEAGTIPKLVAYISQPFASERLSETVLLGLTAICSLREDSRRRVMETKILTTIEDLLESSNPRIRCAACRCVRSLSRSVKILRRSLFDSVIARQIFKLLDDSSLEVQINATGTVCNFVLEFSPMKKVIVENGIIEKLVFLSQSAVPELRLNSIWALKNLTFLSSTSIKTSVIDQFPPERIYEFLSSEDSEIVEQTLSFLRNFIYLDIDLTIEKFETNALLEAIQKIITDHRDNFKVLIQACYVVCNLAAGTEALKNAIVFQTSLPSRLCEFLEYSPTSLLSQSTESLSDSDDDFLSQPAKQEMPTPSPEQPAVSALSSTLEEDLQIATIWCLLNLSWQFDIGAKDRLKKLNEWSFSVRLMMLMRSSNFELRERARKCYWIFADGIYNL